MNHIPNLPLWPFIIISAFIAILGTIYVQRLNAFRTASTKFTGIILNELKDVYPIPSNWPEDIDSFLRFRFADIQAAVSEFKTHLPWYNVKSFDRAWFLYRIGEGGCETHKQDYWQYIPSVSTFTSEGKEFTIDTRDTYEDTFKKNVARLLKYAKKT